MYSSKAQIELGFEHRLRYRYIITNRLLTLFITPMQRLQGSFSGTALIFPIRITPRVSVAARTNRVPHQTSMARGSV